MENLAYREEPRYEILNGKVVMMSPRPATNHNRVSGNIYYAFRSRLEGRPCEAFADGADVHLDEKNTVIPDVMIVCNPDIVKHDGIYGAPDLVVEVLSPSTATKDKGYKKDLYEKHGVKEYWIVDVSAKSVDVYHLVDGKFTLAGAHCIFPDWQWAKMTDEEREQALVDIKVSLFDNCVVKLSDVFSRVL